MIAITAKQLHPISGRPVCRVRVMGSSQGKVQVMALDGHQRGAYYSVAPDNLMLEQTRATRSTRS